MVSVFAYDEEEWDEKAQTKVDNCDLIHVIHFYRFTKWLKKTKWKLNKPFIITSGGTDVNHYLFNDETKYQMQQTIQSARAITVFTEDAKQKIVKAYEDSNLRIEVIPQSVWFPKVESHSPLLRLNQGTPTILLPSGLRKVKDVFFLIDEIKELKLNYPLLQFVIAGMVLEQDVHETLRYYLSQYNWLRFLENVPIEQMPTLYESADIVLNTSISEGQSSALLEAMEKERLIFARHNPGNASIIKDGVNGFLFKDGKEFLAKIEEVLNNNQLQKNIIQNAKNFIQVHHRFEDEIQAYIRLYSEFL